MPLTTTTPAKTTSNVDTNNPPSRHNTLVHLCLAPPRRLLALSTASSTPPTPMRTYIYAHLLPISSPTRHHRSFSTARTPPTR
ncbi:hypothetical protein R3P38DRAFT_3279628 [Favolaschia claudopus]|uniref:Uncharacterized protein n=1 Tax=Favolaschia claudopus TaxID=2862362 RepID=A0AAW0AHZ4_9AGAR